MAEIEKVFVDLKGFCAFCLNLENGVSKCFPRPPLGSCESKTFLEYWSIIQQSITNLTELNGPIPIPTFVITGDTSEVIPFHSSAPPMCSSCSGRFGTILACQNEILQLQLKMELLKKRVEESLEKVRDVITGNTSIVSAGVQGQFDEDTANFLCQVYGRDSISGDRINEVEEDEEYKPNNSPCPPIQDEDEPLSKKSRLEYEDSSEEDEDDEVKSEAPSEDYIYNDHSNSQSDFDHDQDENEDEEPLLGTHVTIAKSKMKDPLQFEEPNNSSGVNITPKSKAPRGSGTITTKTQSGEFKEVQLCEVCYDWVPMTDLYDHLRTHVGDYTFRCPQSEENNCKFAFLSRLSPALLRRHSLECSGSSSLQKKLELRCQECPLKFKSIQRLGNHSMSVHEKEHPEMTLTCPVSGCEKRFAVRQTVEYHLRSHGYHAAREKLRKKGVKVERSRRGRMPSLKSLNPIYSCEICGNRVPKKDRFACLRNHVGEYAYKCPMKNCKMFYHSRYSKLFIVHSQSQSHSKLDVKLKCDACDETFRTEDLRIFKEHIGRHETLEKNFTCPIKDCREAFTLRQNVEYHLRFHTFELTSKKTLQECSLCNDQRRPRFTPSDMETHLKTIHDITEEDLVRCKYCDFIFPNREQILEHIGTHIRKHPVECDICSPNTTSAPTELFSRRSELQKHYLECHKIGKMYICEYCNKPYSTIQSLNFHKEKLHGDGDKLETFKCEECSKEFKTKATFDSHNIRVHGAEPYKCKFCDETFSVKHRRNQHEKIHTYPEVEEKRLKFPCSICGREYTTLGEANRHKKRVHLAPQTKYKCSVESCGKVFSRNESLQRHTRQRHGTGTRKMCEFCGKDFLNEKHLKTHYLIHTGERPFVCDLCGLRFRHKAALYTHKKGHEKHGVNFTSRTFDRTPKE